MAFRAFSYLPFTSSKGITLKPYFAIFFEDGNGWGVRFPDADSVHTCGNTVEEAVEMAVDALSGMLVVGRKGRDYQEPRPYSEVLGISKSGELVFPICPSEKAMESYAAAEDQDGQGV